MDVLIRSIILLLILSPLSFSAPAITGYNNGVVTGTDFGAKVTATPIKWDQFETGSNGVSLNSVQSEWEIYAVENNGAYYSSTEKHSGSLAVVNDFSAAQQSGFATNYFQPAQGEELFVTYWWRIENIGVGESGIIKQTRINSSSSAGGGGVYNGAGDTSYGSQPIGSTSMFTIYNNGSTSSDEQCCKLQFEEWNVWVRIEGYKKLSTAGSSNGIIYTAIIDAGGTKTYFSTSEMTRASGQSFQLDTILLGLMDGGHSGSFEVYLDDIYIDNTRARVEIGDNSVWADCQHREIQIPSAWSTTEITTTLNKGTFPDGIAYLYVVDSDGDVSDSFEITIEEAPVSVSTGGGSYSKH